ncbi:hypothetical protein WDW89_26530 [Deltaproteobacteria bacterium TL4]
MVSLLGEANLVFCIDEQWRNQKECYDLREIAINLKKQGWKNENLNQMLAWLVSNNPVLTLDKKLTKSLDQLVKLNNYESNDIPKLVITSEVEEFSLHQRVKILSDNEASWPSEPIERSAALDQIDCLSFSGMIPLSEVEIVPLLEMKMGLEIGKAFFPKCIDLKGVSKQWKLEDDKVSKVLGLMDVKTLSIEETQERILDQFAQVWEQIITQKRLSLLRFISQWEPSEKLTSLLQNLDVVLVNFPDPNWVLPKNIISPKWFEKGVPPNIPDSNLPVIEKIDPKIIDLWNECCSLKTLEEVVCETLHWTQQAPNPSVAWKKLVEWIDLITSKEQDTQKAIDSQDLVNALQNKKWVLTRKNVELSFQKPENVILHKGAEILSSQFSIVADILPKIVTKNPEEFGFRNKILPQVENIEKLAHCLMQSCNASSNGVLSVYELVCDLIEDRQDLEIAWRKFSEQMPVFRLFQEPDIVMTSNELYLGSEDCQQNFGHLLLCLNAGKDKKGENTISKARKLYQKLGIESDPSLIQIVMALSKIDGSAKQWETTHEQLANILTHKKFTNLPERLDQIRVLTCSGDYQPIKSCYQDEEIGLPNLLQTDSQPFLIRKSDNSSSKILRWLKEHSPQQINNLRDIAKMELLGKPLKIQNSSAMQIFNQWMDWFKQLKREDSIVSERLCDLGYNVPSQEIQISVVEKIDIRFVLPNNNFVYPSDKWRGPEIYAIPGNIFIRQDLIEFDYFSQPDRLEKLDEKIAEELLHIFESSDQERSPDQVGLFGFVKETLERPGVVINRLRKEREDRFFYQYRDQVPDHEFLKLHEEYDHTRSGTEKHEELRSKMFQITNQNFASSRRDQIRNYGYDEYSVFAELVQNAEDAYSQRETIGLEPPEAISITFRYELDQSGKKLIVEHFGRPFNCWRHGNLEVDQFKQDVEGVLRSSGSFKTHATSSNRAIGRFGLGFKSVFLLTDQPTIHSAPWHFTIEAGCLPKEISAPDDLPKGATRIVLPLRENVTELSGDDIASLLNLLPFLRKIKNLNFKGNCNQSNLIINTKNIYENDEGFFVEDIFINGCSHNRGDKVNFLRCCHTEHNGQLALNLSPEGLPVPWDEAFDRDFFVILPLKANLGCGVAISHLFEIQSGRTHLIDHSDNNDRIKDLADLVSGFAGALKFLTIRNTIQKVLNHFWSLWRWDGDSECYDIRKALAESLAKLPYHSVVIPTLDENIAASFEKKMIFYFSQNIPIAFSNKLIKETFILLDKKREYSLSNRVIVPYVFAKNYLTICKFADYPEPNSLIKISWEKIGETLSGSSWFAKCPELLNTLAEELSPQQEVNVLGWLSECQILGRDGRDKPVYKLAKELLIPNFPYKELLPVRFLEWLDPCYNDKTTNLLHDLLKQPSVEHLRKMLKKELILNECEDFLQYLLKAKIYRIEEYDSLKDDLQTKWIPHHGGYISVAEAKTKSNFDNDLFDNVEFCAWLGLIDKTPEPEVDEREKYKHPEFDPTTWLEKLYDWWNNNEKAQIQLYEKRVYPLGHPFNLKTDFRSKDREARKEWLSLFLLGSFHTMGRVKPSQHKEFINKCENKGWLQVFAEPESDANDWMKILDEYLDSQIGNTFYNQWVKQFVSIYQLAKWLIDYRDSFLEIEKNQMNFSINEITISRENPIQQRGGINAPPLTKTLGIGTNFIIRELLRNRVIVQPLAHRHCYVPVGRVRDIMRELGCDGLDDDRGEKADRSQIIHKFLVGHLGENRAIFNHSFDLPLLAVADGDAPRWDLPSSFQNNYSNNSRNGENWVTLSDGRKILIKNSYY